MRTDEHPAVMSWDGILSVVNRLLRFPALTVDACEEALGCEFDEISPNRFVAEPANEIFSRVEIKMGGVKDIVILGLASSTESEEMARRARTLGEPQNIEIVSPPVITGDESEVETGWDRKYSFCYELGNRLVWFGMEESEGKERLMSVAIHWEKGRA